MLLFLSLLLELKDHYYFYSLLSLCASITRTGPISTQFSAFRKVPRPRHLLSYPPPTPPPSYNTTPKCRHPALVSVSSRTLALPSATLTLPSVGQVPVSKARRPERRRPRASRVASSVYGIAPLGLRRCISGEHFFLLREYLRNGHVLIMVV